MRTRTRRLSSAVVLCVLAAGMTSASLAWACTPTNWGWTPPEAPAAGDSAPAPESPSPAEPSQAESPSVSGPSGVTQPQPADSPVGNQPVNSPNKQPAQTPSQQPANVPSNAQGPAEAPVAAAPSPAPELSTQSVGSESAESGSSGTKSPNAPAASGPSERVATDGDLWSGFTSAKSSSLNPGENGTAAPAAGPGGALTVGAGLLGFGMVALFGGLAFAETRRRRAQAQRAGR